MELDEFSMGAASIPLVKQEIRKWSLEEAQIVRETCLQLEDGAAVRSYLKSMRRKE
jgi:phosphoenolpyruvate-protein kinase (PTS system EI component)